VVEQSQKQLPAGVEQALVDLGNSLWTRNFSGTQIKDIVAGLGVLPAQAIIWADAKIADVAGLHQRGISKPSFLARVGLSHRKPPMSGLDLLVNTPDLAPLFLFHRDGYVREAALHRYSDPPDNAFFLAALVYRLNDWAEPVRRAAFRCSEQLFPRVSPEVVVAAAPFLLGRWRFWGRWEQKEASLVDAIFEREDVNALLVERFLQETKGPLATELRYLLRGRGFDRYLSQISRCAVQPSVRAVALKTLINGQATWPTGFGRQWIDKRYNLSRRVTVYSQRSLTEQPAIEGSILQGIRDRSVAVRRVAADALVANRATFQGLDHAIAELAGDTSPAIRERVNFLSRD